MSTKPTIQSGLLFPKRLEWGDDIANLWVGIEQEHFVFHKNGRTPLLSEFKGVFKNLLDFGYRVSSIDDDGLPLSVNKDLDSGYTSIKNDFCTHIVEVAFPPVKDPRSLMQMYIQTWAEIEFCLKEYDLELKKGGSLNVIPPEIHLFKQHKRFSWFEDRSLPICEHIPIERYFTTLMCATQVHLNINSPKLYTYLSSLYACEFLVSLIYSNSKQYAGYEAHCTRPLVWQANLDPSYLANGFPDRIPNSPYEYEQMIKGSIGFLRDYAFICPRDSGSVEFRSACSQDSIDEILELCSLRIAIQKLVIQDHIRPTQEDKADFYKTCKTGSINSNQFEILSKICSVNFDLPNGWQDYLEIVIRKLRQL